MNEATATAAWPGWKRASDYSKRHLLRHAVVSGVARQVLTDIECVVHSDPYEVTSALDTSGEAVPLAAVWRSAGPAVAAAEPVERTAILHLAAARRNDDLADAFARYATEAPWQPKWLVTRPGATRAAPWTGPVTALTFGIGEQEGRLLATTAGGPLHMLSPSDGTPIGRLPNATPAVWGLVCFADGGVLHLDPHGTPDLIAPRKAQSRAEQISSLLNTAPGLGPGSAPDSAGVVKVIKRLSARPTALGADRAVTRVVLGDHTGTVHAWRLDREPPEVLSCDLHDGPVTAVACLRGPQGGHLVISGGVDGAVRYWTPGDAPQSEPADVRGGLVRALSGVLIDGRPVVAVGWGNGDIQLWDVVTGHDAIIRPGFVPTALLLGTDESLYLGGADGLVALKLNLARLLPPASTESSSEMSTGI